MFSPQRTAQEKTNSGAACWRAGRLGFSYHGHHLQVLQIRPLGGQQLFGDEVGPVCRKPLHRHRKQRRGECEQEEVQVQLVFWCLISCVAALTYFSG